MITRLKEILNAALDAPQISEAKGPWGHSHIFIPESGIVIARSLRGVTFALGFYGRQMTALKYIKIAYVLIGCLIKIPGNRGVFLKISGQNIDFILLGKSARVKIFQGPVVLNYFFDHNRFSKRDAFIRRKIAKYDIAPDLLSTSSQGYSESLIVGPTDYSGDLETLENRCLKRFYAIFPEVRMGGEHYAQKIINRIQGYGVLLDIPPLDFGRDITLRMSQGDLHPGNVLQDKSGKLFLIDFEFSQYRSWDYDHLFWLYHQHGLDRVRAAKFPQTSRRLFYLERLELVLSLQHYLKKDYSTEVAAILAALQEPS